MCFVRLLIDSLVPKIGHSVMYHSIHQMACQFIDLKSMLEVDPGAVQGAWVGYLHCFLRVRKNNIDTANMRDY